MNFSGGWVGEYFMDFIKENFELKASLGLIALRLIPTLCWSTMGEYSGKKPKFYFGALHT